MNWIDNMVGYVSPEAGYRREAYRQAMDEMRSYDAGDYGRLNANWRVSNLSAEMTDRYSRDTIRARARDLERNSDMMNSVVGAFKRNVVGSGYRLQANTDNEVFNEQIERQWGTWCKKQNCDVTGTQSLNQMLRMAVVRKKIDGGILFLKVYTGGGLLPFKLQALEVDELDGYQTLPRVSGNKVVGGIEYNSFNRPMGYWIKQYSLDGMTVETTRYVDAKDVIFLYTKTRPSQVREMSDMTQTTTRIRDANEFMTAISVKERIMACLAVFIKKVLPTTGRGRTHDETLKNSYDGKTLAPGMIKELNAGDEVQVVNPAGQSADATEHMRLQQRMIGAGQGLSYEATSRDMSKTNYSSARSAILEDELTYIEEKEIIRDFLNEVYETFLISGVLCGLFNLPDFWERKAEYFEHEWVSAPKRWIDPLKEANANRIALMTGQKTFKQIAAENGKDYREQINEIKEVLDYAHNQGIELGGVLFGKNQGELYGMDGEGGEG